MEEEICDETCAHACNLEERTSTLAPAVKDMFESGMCGQGGYPALDSI